MTNLSRLSSWPANQRMPHSTGRQGVCGRSLSMRWTARPSAHDLLKGSACTLSARVTADLVSRGAVRNDVSMSLTQQSLPTPDLPTAEHFRQLLKNNPERML